MGMLFKFLKILKMPKNKLDLDINIFFKHVEVKDQIIKIIFGNLNNEYLV